MTMRETRFGGDPNKKTKLSKSGYASTHKVCIKCGASIPILGPHTICDKCTRAKKAKQTRHDWWRG